MVRSDQSGLGQEAWAKLRELEDEVKRVEELVLRHLAPAATVPEAAVGSPSPAMGAPAPEERRLAEPAAVLTVREVPRLVADIRRQLDADPLHALALAYPPEALSGGEAPEKVRRACLLHHATNTARLAMFVARRHGYQPTTVDVIGACALVHDIGLERVAAELFVKPGPLTASERRDLEAHAAEGAEQVRSCGELEGLLCAVVPAVVRQHHERTDGSGYPDGLAAPHIHEFAQLIALAEAYETMVSPRPYKPARLPHEAMSTLLLEAFGKGCPARFDRRLAASFLRALSLYPIGSGVRLQTGEVGQVVGSNSDAPERPHVRLLWRPDGRRVERPRVIDLRAAGLAVAQAVPLPPSSPPSADSGHTSATTVA